MVRGWIRKSAKDGSRCVAPVALREERTSPGPPRGVRQVARPLGLVGLEGRPVQRSTALRRASLG